MNTKIILSNNEVINEGGGILVNWDQLESVDSYSGSGCFYELEDVSVDGLRNNTVNITVEFTNNIARKGGLEDSGYIMEPHQIVGVPLDWEQRVKLIVVQ